MSNLLSETIVAIDRAHQWIENIVYIGSPAHHFAATWAEFMQVSDFSYDNGYGSARIPEELVILFRDNSWLERGEYDGAEWWQFKKPPAIPQALTDPITQHWLEGNRL
jgi:hypothetical protein